MHKPCFVLKHAIFVLLVTATALFPHPLHAQQPLSKTVSFRVARQPVDTVLFIISRQCHASFSYTGTPFRRDSIVTLTITNKTVKQTLDLLFEGRVQYIESGDNVILQKAEALRERIYIVSGYVRDKENGQLIANASVYEHASLISTFTNQDGYFHLRLKDKGRQPSAQLMVSKEFYMDTALYVMPGFDREVSITISPAKAVLLREFVISDQVEKTWLGKRLLTEGLKRQTQNISRFLANKPFQSSIVPSVGSHGRMAGQVVNKISLNILGGYAAGLNGVEVAGGFNIDKKDVQYVQIAGLFNIVGGNMKGVQTAGALNTVLRSATGVQIAGLSNSVNDTLRGIQATGGLNRVKKDATGAQVSGLANITGESFSGIQSTGGLNIVQGNISGIQIAGLSNSGKGHLRGLQITGGLNNAGRDLRGCQIAGIFSAAGGSMQGAQLSGAINRNNGETRGLQVSALYNYSGKLRGAQFALINVADSSSGFSFGLINIVRKNGYQRLMLSSDDIMRYNITLKTGRKQFYTLITAGMNDSLYQFGFGIGREFTLNNRWAVTTDVIQQTIVSRSFEQLSTVYRFQPLLHFRLLPWVGVHAGPAFSYADFKRTGGGLGKGYLTVFSSESERGWFGWQAGLSFSTARQAIRSSTRAEN